MDREVLRSLRDRLQEERRALRVVSASAGQSIAEDRPIELEEHAQRQRDAVAEQNVNETENARIASIDAALERMDAGQYGICARCSNEIADERLRAEPTAMLCADCAGALESATAEPQSDDEAEIVPDSGRLPPDLEGLGNDELREHLEELVREDGQVDMHELSILPRKGVVYLEGALPSEGERQVLRNILTDVAGIHDIVDHLEIQRLAWERNDRSVTQDAEDHPPGIYSRNEPYAGTDDITATNEEGVAYDPPDNPPPPPHRRD
jgi:DnaK suppressor protein